MWQGAEAKVELIEYCDGTVDGKAIRKWRFPKSYRHGDLDSRLTRQRTATEARALAKAIGHGLNVPVPLLVVPDRGLLVMSYIADSMTVKEALWTNKLTMHVAGDEMGLIIAKLHSINMVHGDLTTSNFLVQPEACKVWLIDFGLSGQAGTMEDKAVDLYVLERAIKATHSANHPGLFERILAAYLRAVDNSDTIVKRFEEVRSRGRKRLLE